MLLLLGGVGGGAPSEARLLPARVVDEGGLEGHQLRLQHRLGRPPAPHLVQAPRGEPRQLGLQPPALARAGRRGLGGGQKGGVVAGVPRQALVESEEERVALREDAVRRLVLLRPRGGKEREGGMEEQGSGPNYQYSEDHSHAVRKLGSPRGQAEPKPGRPRTCGLLMAAAGSGCRAAVSSSQASSKS